jgi:hypothetical protein
VHRQHDRRFQPADHPHHGFKVHRIAAVHRHHHHIQPPEGCILRRVGFVVQVAQMADAQARRFEHEDRVAILAPDATFEPATRIGMHVAHPHLAQIQVVFVRVVGVPQPSST